MKKFIWTAAILPLFTYAAYAADLPNTKGPPTFAPPPPPVFSWSGLYVGVNVGYGVGDGDTSFTPLPTAAGFGNLAPTVLDIDPGGVIGGAQIGYNYQFNQFVAGFETDFQGTGINGSAIETPIIQNNGTPYGAGSALTTSERLQWLGTARARLGFAPVDRLLVYATGGLAYGQANYTANSDFLPVGTQQYPASLTETRLGWTAGAGIEWAFMGNWSAKIEGLYYDLGSASLIANGVPGQAAGTCGSAPAFCQVGYSWQTKGEIFRVGLNYKFNVLAP